MIDIKRLIAQNLNEKTDILNVCDLINMLEYPPKPEMGDIALPCFKLSQIFKMSPTSIAQNLQMHFDSCDYIERVDSVSGYLNFYLSKEYLTNKVLSKILTLNIKYGSDNIGQGRTVVVDFSAPNIAKPFHVGHLRSTVIGNSLYKIFEFMGYKCIRINHLGDWGTQFGKLIVAYKKWGDKHKIENEGIKELMALYVKYHEESEKNILLDDEARNWFLKMEQGDDEALQLWYWFKEISLCEFNKTYKILGIEFDSYAGESFYNDKMDKVIEELVQKDLLVESDGAMIVELEKYGMPPCLILKKDGSTLYATRDITAAIYRKQMYDFEKCIYVTGASQSLHFQQWIKVVELMGYLWAKDLIHVPFGIVSLEGEKLSTRKGKVILLEDILSEAINKTLKVIEEKNPSMDNKDEVAKQIGVGAVIFSDLSSNRIKDITFSWDEILSFEGETGPYVQYTHSRTCSIIRKFGDEIVLSNLNAQLLNSSEEYELLKTLSLFPEKVKLSLEEMEPSIISRYLLDLSQDFNRFYHECQILKAVNELKMSRLVLVKSVKIVLENGLSLIGLCAPESV